MDDREAIERYDRAGEQRWRVGCAAIRWPDLALDAENLARLAEGILDERCDCARLAFGDECDRAVFGERLSESWRTDALQSRYAPEGVWVRAVFTVVVAIAVGDEGGDHDDDAATETMTFTVELCVSFTHRHHTRPFLDFMGGNVQRASDATIRPLDPFARELGPLDAVGWGLNGIDE